MYKRFLVLALFVPLFGATCDSPEGLPTAQQELRDWASRGLPTTRFCYEQAGVMCYCKEGLACACADSTPFMVWVNNYGCPDAQADACFAYTNTGTIPTIWVKESRLRDDGVYVIRHELHHWLAMCSGIDNQGDPSHSNPRIWWGGAKHW